MLVTSSSMMLNKVVDNKEETFVRVADKDELEGRGLSSITEVSDGAEFEYHAFLCLIVPE